MPPAFVIPPPQQIIGGIAGGGAGVTNPGPSPRQIVDSAGHAVTSTASSFQSAGQFLGRLGNANTWVRVGEFIIGAALLLVGLAHLTGMDSVAGKAAKAAALV